MSNFLQALKKVWKDYDKVTKALASHNASIAVENLPAECDHLKFDGCRYVNGKACYTVGEYKAAKQDYTW